MDKQLSRHCEVGLLREDRRHQQLEALAAEDEELRAPSPRLEAHEQETVAVPTHWGVQGARGIGGCQLAVQVERDGQAVAEYPNGSE